MRSTGCPIRATFRIDIAGIIVVSMDLVSYRFCPACGGRLSGRTLKTGDPERLVCEPARSCSTWIRRSRSARSSAPATIASCWCGAQSNPGTVCGCFRADTSIAASRSSTRHCARPVRSPVSQIRDRGARRRLLVWRDRADHHRVCGDHGRRRAVHRRGMPRGALFTREEIPWDELAFRSTREALERLFQNRSPARSEP